MAADTPISDSSPLAGRHSEEQLPEYNRPEHTPTTEYTDSKPRIPGMAPRVHARAGSAHSSLQNSLYRCIRRGTRQGADRVHCLRQARRL